MKILITRADGFIGSHLTETIVRAGHQVRVFVFYNAHNSWGWLDFCTPDVKDKFEIFTGDIRDPYDSAQEVRNEEITRDEAKLLINQFDGEYPEGFKKEIFEYLSLDKKIFHSILNCFSLQYLMKNILNY